MEVHDIVQDTGIKTIPMENKCKKAKWLYEEDLQIAVKRREAKSKEEKERYKHLNAEFQRIVRRDKKAFLRELFCFFAFLFLKDGLDSCLLYNVTNHHPQFIRHSVYQIQSVNLFLTFTVLSDLI